MTPSRRRLLATTVSLAVGTVAGCLGNGSDATDQETVETVDPDLELNGVTLSSSFPMELYDLETDDRVAEVHWHDDSDAHWHRPPLEIPRKAWRSVEVVVQDSDREQLSLGPESSFRLDIGITDRTAADLITLDVSGSTLSLFGERDGQGSLRIELVTADEVAWSAPSLRFEVLP